MRIHTGLAHVGLAQVLYDRNELRRTRLLATDKSKPVHRRLGAANRAEAAAGAARSA